MSVFSKFKKMLFVEEDEQEDVVNSVKEEVKKEEVIRPVLQEEKTRDYTKEVKKMDNNLVNQPLPSRTLKKAEFNIFEDEDVSNFGGSTTVVKQKQEKVVDPLIELNKEFNQYKEEKKQSIKRTDETRPFKPSPIISPVHGVIDKNPLKKYEAKKKPKSNQEILDDLITYVTPLGVETVKDKKKKETKKEEESNDKVFDLEKDNVPEVEAVTLEDAKTYYNDLGLEYNVNYKDQSTTKKENEKAFEKEIKQEPVKEKEVEIIDNSIDNIPEEKIKEMEEVKDTIKNITNKKKAEEENYNIEDEEELFNLIESMYN